MPNTQGWWRICAVFGVLTLATFVGFSAQTVPSCGTVLAAPMIDFELATTRANLAAVLDCQPRLAELDRQNIVDLGFFMWVYVAFLAAFGRASGVGLPIIAGIAALTLGGDLVETLRLRQIAAAWPQLGSDALTPLIVASRLKFIAIGVGMILSGMALFRRDPRVAARVVAALAIIGGVGNFALLAGVPATPAMLPTLISWLAILLFAAVSALQPPLSVRASPGA